MGLTYRTWIDSVPPRHGDPSCLITITMPMKAIYSSIELLENRIAPAAAFVNATTATYTDSDGDHVTVKFTKPILTSGNVGTILVTTSNGNSDHLDMINLMGISAAVGTGISVTAKVDGTGDGLVNIGKINSDGDLGAVVVHGDLDEIDAGDGNDFKTGVKSISVVSFGYVSYLAGMTSAQSTVKGAVGSLKVATNMISAFSVSDSSTSHGDLGSLVIGGSLLGDASDFSGFVSAPHKIGSVTIGQSMVGGSGNYSGYVRTNDLGNVKVGGRIQGGSGTSGSIESNNAIGSVTVGGSLVGVGSFSGNILAGTTIGAVKIGQDVVGRAAQSGQIEASGIASVTIGGSVFGGSGSSSGRIFCSGSNGGSLGAVKIAGDLQATATSNSVNDTAEIWNFAGSIASVTIGENAEGSPSTAYFNGCILSGGNLGAVKVGGNVTGIGAPFVIRGKGAAANETAIASLTVGGHVEFALVLAGFGTSDTPADGNACIGAVKVGGNWIQSSITAGVTNTAFPKLGDVNDLLIGTPAKTSKIASITIAGEILGTPDSMSSTDHYGFVAGQIGSFKVAGTSIPLTVGAQKDNRQIGLTGDVTIHEVSLQV